VFFQPPYPLLAEHGKEKKKQKNWCRHLSLLLSLLTLSPPLHIVMQGTGEIKLKKRNHRTKEKASQKVRQRLIHYYLSQYISDTLYYTKD